MQGCCWVSSNWEKSSEKELLDLYIALSMYKQVHPSSSNNFSSQSRLLSHISKILGLQTHFPFIPLTFSPSTGDFVAVKKYDVAEIPEKELQLLVEEANLMRSLNHENIVQVR